MQGGRLSNIEHITNEDNARSGQKEGCRLSIFRVYNLLEYAEFQNYGYKGLYGGMTALDIAIHKGIDKQEDILDRMGSAELGANLFRITQTESVMKKNKIDNKEEANATHYRVGKTVRKAIEEIGGTMPEDLPPAEKSIKELEKDQTKKILGKLK